MLQYCKWYRDVCFVKKQTVSIFEGEHLMDISTLNKRYEYNHDTHVNNQNYGYHKSTHDFQLQNSMTEIEKHQVRHYNIFIYCFCSTGV